MSKGLTELRTTRGMPAKVARAIGRTRQAIYHWKRVPAELVVAVEKASGIPRKKLRPDLYAR